MGNAGGRTAQIPVEQGGERLADFILSVKKEDSGKFFLADGSSLPW